MSRGAMFPLLLPLLWIQLVAAAELMGSQKGNGTVPSVAAIAGCKTSCGDLTFMYPFGFGANCSRGPDFALTCNESAHEPPMLLLRDGITQVIENIIENAIGGTLRINIQSTIPVSYGVDVYIMPWTSPGNSFELGGVRLNVTGCNFDIYFTNLDVNMTSSLLCTLTCPTRDITDMVARQNCNGTGCCTIYASTPINSFHLRFVRHGESNPEAPPPYNNRSSLWDYINVTTDYADLAWTIVDQPNCAVAKKNNTNFACAGNNSQCIDSTESQYLGYSCYCSPGYMGNPYLLDGCYRDTEGYNPRHKANCTHACGNITVPFPFGVEEGCYARKQFYLNCTNVTTSTLQLLGEDYYLVTEISIDEGLITYTNPHEDEGIIRPLSEDDPGIFVPTRDFTSLTWVVANLTCSEAQANNSGYACVSANSKCIPINYAHGYVGYRCNCSYGFEGNPYLQNGCTDIDECLQPNICPEMCNNTAGSYTCIQCPRGTGYDPVQRRCTRKHQNFLLGKEGENLLVTVSVGIAIGLSVGLGILLVCLSGVFLIRRWRKDIQRKLRKKYFRKNKGLLLEQLISSDENQSDNKIFTLEELQKATDNFDPTRILGSGGHGTVFKGILSDQRVVAIKRPKVINEREINQFINEVAILSQINHRNIVKLLGCCLETEVPLLVYDFIPNGSLYKIIHDGCQSNNEFSLSWDVCLRIATEAAGALCYLHSAASVSVFHRDVKSSNILLDGSYTAKVSDFGASRLIPIDQTHVVTNVQGTFGYLDPEYYHTGQLNEKSDVYSFGVVLLELLLRKEPIFTGDSGSKQNLSNYFLWEMRSRPITEIVAPQVLEQATEDEVMTVASLAKECLSLRGEERPTMKQVEMKLQLLRNKDLRSSNGATESNYEIQPPVPIRLATHHRQPLSTDGNNRANAASSGCYSLEQEFLSSASLPR